MAWIFFIASIVFVFVGIGCTIFSICKTIEMRRLQTVGTEQSAMIVRVDKKCHAGRGNDASVQCPRLREIAGFKASDGRMIEACLSAQSKAKEAGAAGGKLMLQIDPANPKRADKAQGGRRMQGAAPGIFFGIIFTCAAIFLATRSMRELTFDASVSELLAAVVLAGAAVLLLAGLFASRSIIIKIFFAKDSMQVVMSGGIACKLPEMTPFTGYLKKKKAGKNVVVKYKDGREVQQFAPQRGLTQKRI